MSAATSERMRKMREWRRRAGLREVRLTVPDARSSVVRHRVAEQVRWLDPRSEDEVLTWIEEVSEFDERAPR